MSASDCFNWCILHLYPDIRWPLATQLLAFNTPRNGAGMHLKCYYWCTFCGVMLDSFLHIPWWHKFGEIVRRPQIPELWKFIWSGNSPILRQYISTSSTSICSLKIWNRTPSAKLDIDHMKKRQPTGLLTKAKKLHIFHGNGHKQGQVHHAALCTCLSWQALVFDNRFLLPRTIEAR